MYEYHIFNLWCELFIFIFDFFFSFYASRTENHPSIRVCGKWQILFLTRKRKGVGNSKYYHHGLCCVYNLFLLIGYLQLYHIRFVLHKIYIFLDQLLTFVLGFVLILRFIAKSSKLIKWAVFKTEKKTKIHFPEHIV